MRVPRPNLGVTGVIRAFALGIAALTTALLQSSSSFAQSCFDRATRVNLIVETKYVHDESISTKERNEIHSKTLGLTQANVNSEPVFRAGTMASTCRPHSELNILLNIDVFLDPKIENQCVFDAVVAHEEEHINNWTAMFREELDDIGSRYHKFIKKFKNVNQLGRVSTTVFTRRFINLEHYIENRFKDIEKSNDAFDSGKFGSQQARVKFNGRDILIDGQRQQKLFQACLKNAPKVNWDTLKNRNETQVFSTGWERIE